MAITMNNGRVRVEATCPGSSDPAGDVLYIFCIVIGSLDKAKSS